MENTKAFLAKPVPIHGKLSIPIISIPPKMPMDMLSCCGRRGMDFYFFQKSYKLPIIKPT
jgi:hypothetical protein